ncbi:MAG: hypothetical protein IJ723_07845, partial [Ruminococcus sp.]|nr:hypothetical protein [Ruminococcus sp.]
LAVSIIFVKVTPVSFVLGIFIAVMLYALIMTAIRYRRLEKSYPGDLNADCEACGERVLPAYFFLKDGLLEAANGIYIRYSDIDLVELCTANIDGRINYMIRVSAGGRSNSFTTFGKEGEKAEAFGEICRLFAEHIPEDKIQVSDT